MRTLSRCLVICRQQYLLCYTNGWCVCSGVDNVTSRHTDCLVHLVVIVRCTTDLELFGAVSLLLLFVSFILGFFRDYTCKHYLGSNFIIYYQRGRFLLQRIRSAFINEHLRELEPHYDRILR